MNAARQHIIDKVAHDFIHNGRFGCGVSDTEVQSGDKLGYTAGGIEVMQDRLS